MNEERAKLLLETFADCSGNMHEPDDRFDNQFDRKDDR